MKAKLRFIISTTAILIMSGCVSTKKYQSLQSDNKTLQAKNDALYLDNVNCQNSLASANARITGLQDQLTAERSNLAALQSALDKCLTSAGQGNVNISKLVDEINASNKYIQALIASKNKSDSLNMVLTNNLTRSLSKEEMQDVNVQVLREWCIFLFLTTCFTNRAAMKYLTKQEQRCRRLRKSFKTMVITTY